MITLSCTTNYLPLNYFGSRVIHLGMLILRSYMKTVYIVSVHPFRRNSTNKTFEQTDGQGDPYLTPKNFVCKTLIISSIHVHYTCNINTQIQVRLCQFYPACTCRFTLKVQKQLQQLFDQFSNCNRRLTGPFSFINKRVFIFYNKSIYLIFCSSDNMHRSISKSFLIQAIDITPKRPVLNMHNG